MSIGAVGPPDIFRLCAIQSVSGRGFRTFFDGFAASKAALTIGCCCELVRGGIAFGDFGLLSMIMLMMGSEKLALSTLVSDNIGAMEQGARSKEQGARSKELKEAYGLRDSAFTGCNGSKNIWALC